MINFWIIKIKLIAGLVILFLAVNTYGQESTGQKNFWQKPWEGMPEHYQKWNYPDFRFPDKLSQWQNQRAEIRKTIIKLRNTNFKSIVYPNTGHVYTWQMKMEMLNWFEKYLK